MTPAPLSPAAPVGATNEALPEKVHYGCGGNVREGWLNVDAFKKYYLWDQVAANTKERILDADLTLAHPFPDGSFRFGQAEDFLEHLDQAESLIFLAEAYRTLQPGGVLRLSFPGLYGVLCWHYRKADYQGAVIGQKEAYTQWNHKHFYCLESLQVVARHLGFKSVVEKPFGESDHPELRGLETRREQITLNLIVELTK